jgi:hypothetical protein
MLDLSLRPGLEWLKCSYWLPIAEASERKILWDNGATCYGLPPCARRKGDIMARTSRVIGADGHVLGPVGLWDRYMDPEYREGVERRELCCASRRMSE